MFGLGIPELIVIFSVVLLLFGGKKIPEIAKGLGKGIREFKCEINNTKNSISSLENTIQADNETKII